MRLPSVLEEAVEKEIAGIPLSVLKKRSETLSSMYRGEKKTIDADCLGAYLSARLPATFAAVLSVLKELKRRLPLMRVDRLLDLGAGPGTAMWAAMEVFPEIGEVALFEKVSSMIETGRRLSAHSEQSSVREAVWHLKDLTKEDVFPSADLVILSYSIGEIPLDRACLVLEKFSQERHPCLAIIEPGTPDAFERMKIIREYLLGRGWTLLAPCPHQKKCSMEGKDWCHFSTRLERSSLHRLVKEGSLGYEDEKFSYLVFAAAPKAATDPRIIRHPVKYPGHCSMTLCTNDGIKNIIISKKQKDKFKSAKKLKWGDTINLSNEI